MEDDKKGLRLQSMGSAEIVDDYLTKVNGTKTSLVVMLGLLLLFILLMDKYNEYLLTMPLILIVMPVLVVFFLYEIVEFRQTVFVRGLIMTSKLNRNTLVTLLLLVKPSTSIYFCEMLTHACFEDKLGVIDNLVFKDNRVYYVIGYDSESKSHVKLPIDKTSGKLLI